MATTAAKALLVVAMATAVLGTAYGANYTVGAPAGSWDLQTNYAQWSSNIRFQVGDQLVFKYSRTAHNVVEVNKADYDSCSGSSPIASFQTGNDVVPLAAAGSRYFICGVPGHCDGGMKVRVNVEAATSAGAPSPVSRGAPAPAVPPMPSARAPVAGGQAVPPSSSSAASTSIGSVGLCLGTILAAGLMVFY